METQVVPALPVARRSARRGLVGGLALVGAALVAAPAVRATPTTPRLYAVTAEVVARPGETPYACALPPIVPVTPRLPMRHSSVPVTDPCIHVPVAGVTAPGLARLVGSYRNGTFYVLAQGAPGPVPEPEVLPPRLPFCCPGATRYTREQVFDALNDARLLRVGTYLARGPDGEPLLSPWVLVVTDEVEAFVASHPPGLVQPIAWLRPLENWR